MAESDRPEGIWKLANIQRDIAKDVWPNGATLICTLCGNRRDISSVEAGRYLRDGWPKHCDRTMQLTSPT